MGQPLQTKTAIQSKTVRLNLLSIVSIILNALLNDPSFTELVGGFIVMILNGTLIGIRIFDTDTKIDGIVKPKQSTDIRDEHEKILKDAEDAYFPNDSPWKKAIVIGHSFENQGAYGNSGQGEWQFWDELIAEMNLRGMLPKDTYVFYRSSYIKGYTAQMKDLHKRIDKVGCKVSIECHFNSFKRPEANGNEVLYCSKGGKKIAKIFDEEFDALPNNDRGIKRVTKNDRGGGFCCRGKSKAIIIEPFFGARQSDYIYDGKHRDLLLECMQKALERL